MGKQTGFYGKMEELGLDAELCQVVAANAISAKYNYTAFLSKAAISAFLASEAGRALGCLVARYTRTGLSTAKAIQAAVTKRVTCEALFPYCCL